MYFKDIFKEDEKDVLELLLMLDVGDKDLYIRGKKDEKFKEFLIKKIYQSTDNKGIIISYIYDNFIRTIISFKREFDNREILNELDNYFWEAKNKKPQLEFDLALNNKNKNIVEFFRNKYNFKLKWEGSELTILKDQYNNFSYNGGLVSKSYEEEHLDDYLGLLDRSFVLIAPPNSFKNDRDNMKEIFKKKSNAGEFQAFWLGDELIGLYYLEDNLIDVIGVDSKYQNKGYGTIILKSCLNNMFYNHNRDLVYLYIVEQNTGAKGFYLRNDFKVTGNAVFLRYIS